MVVVSPSRDGPLVDGKASTLRLVPFEGSRATLVDEGGGTVRVLLGPVEQGRKAGTDVREIVVGGWRVVVEMESEVHASLRERATRGRNENRAGDRSTSVPSSPAGSSRWTSPPVTS